jgi:PIN domain nuclease of toxin-antitoxin system
VSRSHPGNCELPAAIGEWTRDPFDRLIVAKANGFAWLISADESSRQHYPHAV